ncbi:Heme A synthase, cytochrome oxidase biogenesis protein Cox15-CtaA [Vibrio chagasii]|uniref:COX15/CtaA family protein n=1 Tax=Vibrio chagasii TaxID=170679 RepID=UPI0016402B93|nr:COX15/CtaA family protein [Vibrio chagasii]CAH6990418.1 Heme A synthase, cytochrome oxidase biogenesis protein Cox15-CtaA [Vibrio chagasii]CAH7067959.1 Heme A synthase, cytochrome oxidase biogenesis protein Cox15-CtaA [Vibrio chagasii]CAH7077144.1 Heme A synthase, cytochrome oxidase biogenesis protein Cox15-CtaA [Vibrio chagasii]CAH7080013.1 Heme A synthase, cytochrome oxidase biogenesis protein Cox15-CtaA [Vibrio chagasii]CAH7357802.1 Heme A synthase, cytochrome oxidase biogenesis protein 
MQNKAPDLLMLVMRVTILLTLTVIVLGAYTRLSDAGLGCPDWPGCYGKLTVPSDAQAVNQANLQFPERALEADKAWIEMIHRYFAGSLGLLIFVVVAWCIKKNITSAGLPLLIAATVIFQALLGMWTVTLKLMPVVVMAHLMGGFTLLSLLCLLYCRLSNFQTRFGETTYSATSKFAALLGLMVVIGQILLGGWTSSNYAALVCTQLPICEGNWTSYLDFKNAFDFAQHGHDNYEFGVLEYPARLTIHIMHRFGAIVATITVLMVVYQLWKLGQTVHQKLGVIVALVLAVQVSLGISNVWFHLPISVAVLHNLVAAMLLVSLVVTNFVVWQRKPSERLVKNSVLQGGNHGQ